MTRVESWSVSGLMVVAAACVVVVAVAAGYLLGAESLASAIRLGSLVVGLHGVASLLAGLVVGSVWGPSAAVGGHLGLYNLATPVAVWARVAWLERHRPGFLPAGFFGKVMTAWAVLLGSMVVAAWLTVRM